MDGIDEATKMKMIHHILYYTPAVIVNRWKPKLNRRNRKTKRKRSSLKNLSVVQSHDKTTSCPKRIKKDFPNNLTLQTAEDASMEFASNAELQVVIERIEVNTSLASAAPTNTIADDQSVFQSTKNVSGTNCVIGCDNIHNLTKCKLQKKDSTSQSKHLPENSISVEDSSKTHQKENSSVSNLLEEDVVMMKIDLNGNKINSSKVATAHSNSLSDVIIIDNDGNVNENEAGNAENSYPLTSLQQDVIIEDCIRGHLDKVRHNGSVFKVTETICVDHHDAFTHNSIANSPNTTEISAAVVPPDNISDIENVITMGTSVNSISGVKSNGMTSNILTSTSMSQVANFIENRSNTVCARDTKTYSSAQKSAKIISNGPVDCKQDFNQQISISDIVNLVNSLPWASSSSFPSSSSSSLSSSPSSTSSSSFSLRAILTKQTETYSHESHCGETKTQFSAIARSSVDNGMQSENLSSVGPSSTENQLNPMCYGATESVMTSNQTNASYRRCSYTEEIVLLQKFPCFMSSQSKFSETEKNVINHDVRTNLSTSKTVSPTSVSSKLQSKILVSTSSKQQQPASSKLETMEQAGSHDNEVGMLVSKKIISLPSKICPSSAVNKLQVLNERPSSVPLSSKNFPNLLQFTKNKKHTASCNIKTDTPSNKTKAKPAKIFSSSVSNEIKSLKKMSSLVLSSPKHQSTTGDNDAGKSIRASIERDLLLFATSRISCKKPTVLRKSPSKNQAVLEMVTSKNTEKDDVLSERSPQFPKNSVVSFGDELLMLDELYSSRKNKVTYTEQGGNMKSQTINNRATESPIDILSERSPQFPNNSVVSFADELLMLDELLYSSRKNKITSIEQDGNKRQTINNCATENAIKLKKMCTSFGTVTKPLCYIEPLVKSTLSFASASEDTLPSLKVAIGDRTSRSCHHVGKNLMCAGNVNVHPDKTVPFSGDFKVQSFDELSQPRASIPITIAMSLSSEILSEDTFDLDKLQDFGKVMQEIASLKIKESFNVHDPNEVGCIVGERHSSAEELAIPAALASQAHHELSFADRLLPNVIKTKPEVSEFLELRRIWLKPENELKKSSIFFIDEGLTGIPFISIFFQRAFSSSASLSLEFSNLNVLGLNAAMITSICRHSFTEENQNQINLIAKILFRFHHVLLVRFSLLNKMEQSPMTTAEKDELTNKIDTKYKRLMMFDFDKLKKYINQLITFDNDRHYELAFQLMLLRIAEIFTNFLHVRKGDMLHFVIALLSTTFEYANITDERFLRMLRLENLYKITSELRQGIVAEESCILFSVAVPMCQHSLVHLSRNF